LQFGGAPASKGRGFVRKNKNRSGVKNNEHIGSEGVRLGERDQPLEKDAGLLKWAKRSSF